MKSEPLRVMVVGAHPDDADLRAGAATLKLVDRGARVRFVSVANGDLGHQTMPPADLAARRLGEARASGRVFGIEEYAILGYHDCAVEPTLELRRRLTRLIRAFAPHVVMTHRTCDYHADHRAVGTAVMDVAYLLGVPHWCPETPRPPVLPAVFFLTDPFTVPRPLRPDLLIGVDQYVEQCVTALLCHESQFFEWLPFDGGFADEVPDVGDDAARRAFIVHHWLSCKTEDAVRYGDVWRERNPGTPLPTYLEAFEFSEYGRAPTEWELSWFK